MAGRPKKGEKASKSVNFCQLVWVSVNKWVCFVKFGGGFEGGFWGFGKNALFEEMTTKTPSHQGKTKNSRSHALRGNA